MMCVRVAFRVIRPIDGAFLPLGGVKHLGSMLFWFIAIAITAIACAALFYAAGGRTVNVSAAETGDSNSHFRLVLAGIDADLAAGKLGEAEANAARSELAREIIRLKAETGKTVAAGDLGRTPLLVGLAGIAILAFAIYAALGNPNLPGQPLADRTEIATQSLDLGTAVARIEQQLAAKPDDVRGWAVIAPAYTEMGRFADAAKAYRRVIELSGPTPKLQTSLAEALLLESNGAGSDEAMTLLRAASVSDPADPLPRLYLAAELTRTGQYDEAATAWQGALALSQGTEPWLAAAQQGLAVAQNDGAPAGPSPGESQMIAQMVGGLADRLASQGGSVEEWMQLVRAYLVLGDKAQAQMAYDDAVAAYPKAFDRGELDSIALNAGLTLNGATP
ncbi:Cytochrome c heme lyase subunit CcmH [Devosia sp. LC5]|nr:Cytochrome c heme lyase subunit CcmH [Devosia sp. LC5]